LRGLVVVHIVQKKINDKIHIRREERKKENGTRQGWVGSMAMHNKISSFSFSCSSPLTPNSQTLRLTHAERPGKGPILNFVQSARHSPRFFFLNVSVSLIFWEVIDIVSWFALRLAACDRSISSAILFPGLILFLTLILEDAASVPSVKRSARRQDDGRQRKDCTEYRIEEQAQTGQHDSGRHLVNQLVIHSQPSWPTGRLFPFAWPMTLREGVGEGRQEGVGAPRPN
jgi:hypothetical protein